MKSIFSKTLLLTLFVATVGAVQAQISTIDLNSSAIHEFGTTFNPRGKFAAFGESGGVIGPTTTGCDLYGFRAQFNPSTAINIGIQGGFIPTISTSTNRGLVIAEENTLTPSPFGPQLGCGSVLAFFQQSNINNNVLILFGGAQAIGGVFTPSDKKLKRDIELIENPMEIINRLNGYTYEYRTDELPALNLPKGQRYGFVIQEVEEVMPSIVRQSNDMNGELGEFKVMEYDAILPVLTEAIKVQQNEITGLEGTVTSLEDEVTTLREENRTLEARLARLEALMGQDGASIKKVDPIDNANSGIELGQNRPNPAGGNTSVDYTLPENMTNASFVVFDLNGREISSQAMNDVSGVVELNTGTWAPGTYIYAVVVEGRTLARKKMIVQ